MKRTIWFSLSAVLIVASLTSCLYSSVTVTVRKDGSAVVRDSTLIGGFMGEMLFSKSRSGDDPFTSDSALKADALAYGPDVRVVSKKKIKRGDRHGYTAEFIVPDVNNLTLYTSRSASKLSSDENSDNTRSLDTSSPVRFAYKPGILTMFLERDEQEEVERSDSTDNEPPTEAEMQMAIEMIKRMFEGTHVICRVRVEGKIKSTTAKYVHRNEVTLMDFNADRFFDAAQRDPSLFERAKKATDGKTMNEQFYELLPEGVAKVEFQPIVVINF